MPVIAILSKPGLLGPSMAGGLNDDKMLLIVFELTRNGPLISPQSYDECGKLPKNGKRRYQHFGTSAMTQVEKTLVSAYIGM